MHFTPSSQFVLFYTMLLATVTHKVITALLEEAIVSHSTKMGKTQQAWIFRLTEEVEVCAENNLSFLLQRSGSTLNVLQLTLYSSQYSQEK